MPPLPTPGSDVLEDTRTELDAAADTPWQVILHNDPVNLTSYVTRTLMLVLRCSQEQAEHYMLRAHLEGRTAVADGTQEHCLTIATQLGNASLYASIERAGQ